MGWSQSKQADTENVAVATAMVTQHQATQSKLDQFGYILLAFIILATVLLIYFVLRGCRSCVKNWLKKQVQTAVAEPTV